MHEIISNNLLALLFGSTVIGTFVSSLFSWNSGKESRKISSITDQRANWRKNILKISDDINKSRSIENLQEIIQPLKTIINPFGKSYEIETVYKIRDFQNDRYVWDALFLIDKIGDKTQNINLKEYKDRLQYRLAILLKYDWERSKKEVQGDNTKFLIYFSLIIVYFSLSMLMYKFIFVEFKDKPVEFFFTMLLIYFFVLYLASIFTITNKKLKTKVYLLFIIIFIIFIIFLNKFNNIITRLNFLGALLIMSYYAVLIITFIYSVYLLSFPSEQKYVDAINKNENKRLLNSLGITSIWIHSLNKIESKENIDKNDICELKLPLTAIDTSNTIKLIGSSEDNYLNFKNTVSTIIIFCDSILNKSEDIDSKDEKIFKIYAKYLSEQQWENLNSLLYAQNNKKSIKKLLKEVEKCQKMSENKK